MAARLPKEIHDKIDLLLAAGMRRVAEIQQVLDDQDIKVGHVAIGKRKEEWLAQQGVAEADPDVEATAEPVEVVKSFEEKGDTAKIECTVHASGGIVTEDDIVRVCGIDLSRWRIARFQCRAYQTAMKLEVKEESPSGGRRRIHQQPHVVQLHSVWVDLERILPRDKDDGYERAFQRLAVEPICVMHPVTYSGGDAMFEFDLFDVHFGKLAWRGETGQDYDLRLAENVFANAVEDLIWETRGVSPERIIVPFGNDYVHTDSGQNKTTGGTPVDTDGRRDKIYEVALMSFIRAIQRLREVAPVEVVRVPGNHDRDTSLTMGWALKAWFRDVPGVAVDITPGPRKYRLYGRTLIGYEHGDNLTNAQVRDLAAVMMSEAPRDWLAQAEFREFHIGHRHSERRFTTLDTESSVGLVTRWMHSLSATDAWHHMNKFIGNRRAAELYRYHRDHGYKGHSLALARAS